MKIYTVNSNMDIGGQIVEHVMLFSTEESAQDFYTSLINSLSEEEDKEEVFISYVEVF